MTERSPDAQAAIVRGRAAEQAGDLIAARRAYEYAQRIVPDDREVTFAVGTVRLRLLDPRAAEPFELLAHRDGFREAWLCLVKVRMLTGHPGMAADELEQMLACHAPPEQASVHELCLSVATAAGRPGWCGLTGNGVLHVGLRPKLRAADLHLKLDDRTMSLPVPDAADRRDGRFAPLKFIMPARWRQAGRVTVEHKAGALLGSAMRVASIARVEGFVAARDGGLRGWVWLPGDPDQAPEITIREVLGRAVRGGAPTGRSGKALTVVARDPAVPSQPLARPRAFKVDAADLARFSGPVEVLGPDGRNLYGSPLDPGQERRSAAAAVDCVRRLFPAAPVKPVPAERRRGGAGRRATDAALPELPAVPADIVGDRPAVSRKRRLVDVVVPVYRGLAETIACISSVLASLATARGDLARTRVLVIDDASPDAELVAALRGMAREGRIVLSRLPANVGFPSAVNAGIRLAGDRDVVLLNSDTICPPGWLDRLRAAALSAPDIGSVTPLSNDATILSYPSATQANPVPDRAETIRLDAIAAACTPDPAAVIDLPTGIGFCMYVRRDCLEQTGLLREDVFAQGYGEENDFCVRARHLGWRHVVAPGVFIGHVGGQSFGAAKAHLIARNLEVLNRLHPGYEAMVHDWVRRDPLRDVRRRMDILRWEAGGADLVKRGAAERASGAAAGAVILVTHDREGGVRHHVEARAAALREAGTRAVILSPDRREAADNSATGSVCQVQEGGGAGGDYPSLAFALPAELDALAALLRRVRPSQVEIHHTIGHDRSIMRLPALLGVPYDVVVHDYSWVCPRINLVSTEKRYCGEPALDGCETCYADLGSATGESIRPTELLRRSAIELGGARRLLMPSADLAKRMQRHLPSLRPDVAADGSADARGKRSRPRVRLEVQPWEDDGALPGLCRSSRPANAPIRVAVIGAIGIEKGYDILLACARDARSRVVTPGTPGLEFVVVGYTCGDQRLLDVGVSITGRYDDAEVVDLIRQEAADLAFLPSLWPETWSYTLGQAWRAGLQAVAFGIGAPADRIRATGRGLVVPFGVSPAATNQALLAAGQLLRLASLPGRDAARVPVAQSVAAAQPARANGAGGSIAMADKARTGTGRVRKARAKPVVVGLEGAVAD